MNFCNFDIQATKALIADFHAKWGMALRNEMTERVVFEFLKSNGCSVKWHPFGHGQGADIFVRYKDSELGVSVKSGKLPVTDKGNYFKINSYRTKSYPLLRDKIKHLGNIEKNTYKYIALARKEPKIKLKPIKDVTYFFYVIDPLIFKISSFDFKSDVPDGKGDYYGENDLGVKIKINDTMSSQVWYTVPVTILHDINISNKIFEIGPFRTKTEWE